MSLSQDDPHSFEKTLEISIIKNPLFSNEHYIELLENIGLTSVLNSLIALKLQTRKSSEITSFWNNVFPYFSSGSGSSCWEDAELNDVRGFMESFTRSRHGKQKYAIGFSRNAKGNVREMMVVLDHVESIGLEDLITQNGVVGRSCDWIHNAFYRYADYVPVRKMVDYIVGGGMVTIVGFSVAGTIAQIVGLKLLSLVQDQEKVRVFGFGSPYLIMKKVLEPVTKQPLNFFNFILKDDVLPHVLMISHLENSSKNLSFTLNALASYFYSKTFPDRSPVKHSDVDLEVIANSCSFLEEIQSFHDSDFTSVGQSIVLSDGNVEVISQRSHSMFSFSNLFSYKIRPEYHHLDLYYASVIDSIPSDFHPTTIGNEEVPKVVFHDKFIALNNGTIFHPEPCNSEFRYKMELINVNKKIWKVFLHLFGKDLDFLIESKIGKIILRKFSHKRDGTYALFSGFLPKGKGPMVCHLKTHFDVIQFYVDRMDEQEYNSEVDFEISHLGISQLHIQAVLFGIHCSIPKDSVENHIACYRRREVLEHLEKQTRVIGKDAAQLNLRFQKDVNIQEFWKSVTSSNALVTILNPTVVFDEFLKDREEKLHTKLHEMNIRKSSPPRFRSKSPDRFMHTRKYHHKPRSLTNPSPDLFVRKEYKRPNSRASARSYVARKVIKLPERKQKAKPTENKPKEKKSSSQKKRKVVRKKPFHEFQPIAESYLTLKKCTAYYFTAFYEILESLFELVDKRWHLEIMSCNSDYDRSKVISNVFDMYYIEILRFILLLLGAKSKFHSECELEKEIFTILNEKISFRNDFSMDGVDFDLIFGDVSEPMTNNQQKSLVQIALIAAFNFQIRVQMSNLFGVAIVGQSNSGRSSLLEKWFPGLNANVGTITNDMKPYHPTENIHFLDLPCLESMSDIEIEILVRKNIHVKLFILVLSAKSYIALHHSQILFLRKVYNSHPVMIIVNKVDEVIGQDVSMSIDHQMDWIRKNLESILQIPGKNIIYLSSVKPPKDSTIPSDVCNAESLFSKFLQKLWSLDVSKLMIDDLSKRSSKNPNSLMKFHAPKILLEGSQMVAIAEVLRKYDSNHHVVKIIEWIDTNYVEDFKQKFSSMKNGHGQWKSSKILGLQ